MRQPHSIRLHLAAVFLLFFALVAGLGAFSMWRLANFNSLSADVAKVWLPTTRALADLSNYTSDFRAFEGNALLATNPGDFDATEKEMTDLDRAITGAQRDFEHIRHDAAEAGLCDQFKTDWTAYRDVVNRMLVLARTDRRDEALQIYGNSSRVAYNLASDRLDQLTDQAVANAQIASDRLAVDYRHAFWLILVAIAIAALLVVAALIHISRSISAPLLALADRMRRLAGNDTDSEVPATERRDEIGAMAQATVVFRNNAIALMRSQDTLARQAALLEEQLAQEQRLALLQRNFVSMASHEFRTPMTVIDGHARRLAKVKDTIAPAEIGERAGKIRSAILRMTQLIENLLNSSRLIDGGPGLYLNVAPMDLRALLQEVCQLHREMVPGLDLNQRFAKNAVPSGRRRQALVSGFQQSALECRQIFTCWGPHRGDDGKLAGSGCDRGVRSRHRHPGERSGAPVRPLPSRQQCLRHVGTGVGLYLVKTAVELHHGTVEVQSREGEGSCFTVRLPLAALAPATSPSAAAPLLADA